MRKYMKVFALVLTLAMMISTFAFAATEVQINASTTKGMEWLAEDQNGDGSWGTSEHVAHTGLAVLKFETHALNMGINPFDEGYDYSDEIEAGLNYIFMQSNEITCGIEATTVVHHGNYNTATALMAIVASGCPDRVIPDASPLPDGMTYKEVAEGMVEYFVKGQYTAGTSEGGWGYNCAQPYNRADNSNSGYVVLALEYARSAYYGFNIHPPQSLIDHLEVWIETIQDPVTGESWYTPDWRWPNLLKSGNLLQQMNFVGWPVDDPRVELAIEYIVNNWADMTNVGWRVPPQVDKQTVFTLMKGFEAYGIDILDPGGADIDWFDEISTALVAEQYGPGYWLHDRWAGGHDDLCTAWSLLTLQKVSPPLTVEIDIKPGSDPNGINLRSKGVIPVAILTTEVFDATTVDPASVMFAGAYPLRWSIEDVDFDGDHDMLFFFKTQETDIMPGDTEAELTGMTLGGKDFTGVDSVKTVPKE